MYFRVPTELQQSLLRDVKKARLRISILFYLPLVLIFSGFAVVLLYAKGHGLVWLLREFFGYRLSESAASLLLLCVLLGIVGVVGIVMAFILRQGYKEIAIEQHRFCDLCMAVDDDTGRCPVCQKELKELAGFYRVFYTDDKRIVTSYGLQPYTKTSNSGQN